MKKVFIDTASCPKRRLDANRMKNFFLENAWELTQNCKDADMVLFGTCGVTDKAENKCVRKLQRYDRKKKPGSQLIAFGCLPAINAKKIKSISGVDMLDVYSTDRLNEIIEAHSNINKYENIMYDNASSKRSFWLSKLRGWASLETLSKAYYIPISSGCLSHCSYCAIKLAIGNVKSRNIDEIMLEVDKGIKKGHGRFVLSADDCASYGRDIGTNFTTLLKLILKKNGNHKISIFSFNPKWWSGMRSEMLELCRSEKIDYISVPLQSGSDKILRLMNREYTAKDFIDCIRSLRNVNPKIKFRTDIIVGFPGEEDEDFRKTLDIVDMLGMNYVSVNIYSMRPGTKKFPEEMKVSPFNQKKRLIAVYLSIYKNRIKRILGSP